MENLESIIKEAPDLRGFSKMYFDYMVKLVKGIDYAEVEAFVNELASAKARDNTVFFAGNGGSAATASHIVNDLGVCAAKEKGRAPLRCVSLCDGMPSVTAVANDTGYENVFLYQLKVQYRKGDALAVISASGNSPSVVKAAEWVNENGGRVMGILGFDGGKLLGLCDTAITIKADKGEYGPVENIHVILGHLIFLWLKERGV